MNQATANNVPNSFVQIACLGNAWAARTAWVTRIPELKGFSPFEVWNHPELLLSEEDRERNPGFGPLTMTAIRSRIINTVKPHCHVGATLTPADVRIAYSMPFVSTVREEDPVAIPEVPPTIRSPAGSSFFAHRGHRSRPRSRAFRAR